MNPATGDATRSAAAGGDGYSQLPMAGVVLIVLALLLIPVMVLMSGGVASGILGQTLWRDGQRRFEGSELDALED